MTPPDGVGRARRAAGWTAVALAAALLNGIASPFARADEASAWRILRAMSDYLSKQGTLTLTFDADVEVVSPNLEKIQFTNSGNVVLDRQAGLRASRTGGYADVELVFDGKNVAVHNRGDGIYATADISGSVDQLVDRMRTDFFFEIPGGDLLLNDPFKALTTDVIEAKHIGQGVIGGVDCEHLAFRSIDTDWQIWVQSGDRPIPRKYVITSKTAAQGPQYTLRIRDFQTDTAPPSNAFTFTPPEGTRQVAMNALGEIDAIPPGESPKGATQ